MTNATLLTPNEHQTLSTYDRQRRLRLAKGIATSMGAVTATALVFIISSVVVRSYTNGSIPPFPDPTWQILLLTLGVSGLFTLALVAAKRDDVDVAAGAVIAAIALGSTAYLLLTNYNFVMGPHTYLGILSIMTALVCVGYLASLWTLIGATLVVNALTIGTLLLGKPFPVTNAAIVALFHTPALTENTFLVLDHTTALKMIPALIILQWTFVGLMIAGSISYQQTLTDLGDVRVALRRARQLEAMKNQFITTVNHELRNPVMRMQTYVELLRIKGKEVDVETRTELIQQASRAGKALISLIATILDVRQIDSDVSHLIFGAVPLHQTVLKALLLANLDTGAHPVHIAISEDLVVWGDETRVQQIFTNLLSNAGKYSPPQSPIEVAASTQQHGTRPLLEITVRDYGLGIPPEEVSLLFQRFARLPRDLASNVVGSGLGLYLCRIYAESMGGLIWVESTGNVGEGTTFHLQLPITKE